MRDCERNLDPEPDRSKGLNVTCHGSPAGLCSSLLRMAARAALLRNMATGIDFSCLFPPKNFVWPQISEIYLYIYIYVFFMVPYVYRIYIYVLVFIQKHIFNLSCIYSYPVASHGVFDVYSDHGMRMMENECRPYTAICF